VSFGKLAPFCTEVLGQRGDALAGIFSRSAGDPSHFLSQAAFSEEARADKELVMMAVSRPGMAGPGGLKLRSKRARRSGGALESASEELRQDREATASAQNALALLCPLQHALLRSEVVQAAVLNGAAVPPAFNSDRELVLEAPTDLEPAFPQLRHICRSVAL